MNTKELVQEIIQGMNSNSLALLDWEIAWYRVLVLELLLSVLDISFGKLVMTILCKSLVQFSDQLVIMNPRN
jgi:hypothetical protein